MTLERDSVIKKEMVFLGMPRSFVNNLTQKFFFFCVSLDAATNVTGELTSGFVTHWELIA